VSAGFVVVEPELVDFGLGETAPPLSGNVMRDMMGWTIGMRQYTPEGGVDGHFVSSRASAQGADDAVWFVTMALRGEVPTIGQ
jgi:hypothetical protein